MRKYILSILLVMIFISCTIGAVTLFVDIPPLVPIGEETEEYDPENDDEQIEQNASTSHKFTLSMLFITGGVVYDYSNYQDIKTKYSADLEYLFRMPYKYDNIDYVNWRISSSEYGNLRKITWYSADEEKLYGEVDNNIGSNGGNSNYRLQNIYYFKSNYSNLFSYPRYLEVGVAGSYYPVFGITKTKPSATTTSFTSIISTPQQVTAGGASYYYRFYINGSSWSTTDPGSGSDVTSGDYYIVCRQPHYAWFYSEGSYVNGKTIYDSVRFTTASAPTRTGYTFNGWKLSGTTTTYSAGAYVPATSVTGDLEFDATWTPKSYTVTFNANGGTTSTTSKSVTYTSTYGTLPTPTRTNYSFGGWYTDTTWATQITSSSTKSTAAAETLYAKWLPLISFSLNGGSGTTPSTLTKQLGVTLTIPANNFTRTGYTANGWNASSTLTSSPSYTTQYTADTPVTLYANWTPNPTTMYFRYMIETDPNGTTYDYVASPSGYSVTVSYYSTTLSGNSSAYTTDQITTSKSLTMRQSSTASLLSANVTCPAGYVFAGASTSTSASTSISRTATSSTSYSIAASTTNNGSKYTYLFFKRVSENQLKYDPIDKYFYFEDGEFPQTAVRTYDTAFETVLRGVDLNSLKSYESLNGQTLYVLQWDGSTTGYDAYKGQRFAGYIPSVTRTITLTEPQKVSYTFTAGTTYWFRFDPIRWRVSDFGISSTSPPTNWDTYLEGTVYNASTTTGVAVSDVLWYDMLDADDSLTQGSSAADFDIVSNLASLFDGDYGIKYSAGNAIRDLDSYTSSTSGTNKKVATSNVTPTDVQARYIRFVSNGSTANTSNHITKVSYKTGTTVYTVVDASVQQTCTTVAGSLSYISGTYPYYNASATTTLDLGTVKNISGIYLRRYYADKRSYYGQKIEISTDNVNWQLYYDSRNKGSFSSADTTNLYKETVDGRWFYSSLSPRVASLQELGTYQKNNLSYGSDLACVMAGVNQNVPFEYWTRNLGQTIGNGTYVTRSGQIITSSGYDQAKGIRFATSFGESSRGASVGPTYTDYTSSVTVSRFAYSNTVHRWSLPASTFRVGDIIRVEITYSSTSAITSVDINDVSVQYQIIGNKLVITHKVKSSNYIGTYSFIDINFNASALTSDQYNALTYSINSYIHYRPT